MSGMGPVMDVAERLWTGELSTADRHPLAAALQQLEEVDAGARKLEYLADAVSISTPMRANGPSNDAVDGLGQIDRQIVEELDVLHRVVHELEKAYTHDERFEMNLSELRGIIERIADFIEQRNVALSR